MRAFVVTGPHTAAVEEVPDPAPGDDEAVIDVTRVGVCGTDVEIFHGSLAYLQNGVSTYPIRIGHEWAGVVSEVGRGVDRAWLGRRVMGDTMIGDGTCGRCRAGRHHVCEHLREVGIRGYDGALADRLVMPVRSLHVLPAALDDELGALVEPAGTALRASRATGAATGDAVLVVGAGTIGLLSGMFLRAAGVDVHVADVDAAARDRARALGFEQVWDHATPSPTPFRAVVDAATDPGVAARALATVEPGGRFVAVGVAGRPSTIDTRQLVLGDLTAIGILSASPALADTIAAFAAGTIDPRPLVAGVVPLERTGDVLSGWRPPGAGPGPKIHIDPRTTWGPGETGP